MAEVRRYIARNIEAAERRLEADTEEFRARGMRPTWRIWIAGHQGWIRRGVGQLVVQFDSVEPRPRKPGTPWHLLAPLEMRLRIMVRLLTQIHRQFAELSRERPAGSALAQLHNRRAQTRELRDLLARSRNLEIMIRDVEQELERLEKLTGN
jgi:hypothetical protein